MHPSDIDFADIQGVVRFAHGHLSEACFLLVRVADPAAAGAWLKSAPITTAVIVDPPPDTALQVAFTRQGLRALGLPDAVSADFSDEFLSGMAGDESRSRRLGDVGDNDPATWVWGGPTAVPDLILLLYAAPGKLESWKSTIKDDLWSTAFTEQTCLATTDMGGVEPFGFADGGSQPELDWRQERRANADALPDYGNIVALGEFLLGYPNEYGKYTDRPLIGPTGDAQAAGLPPAEDVLGRRDLARNGTYLVMRQLRQDVQGFWQFLDKQVKSEPRERLILAEAMVGRRLGGEPLMPLSNQPIAGVGPKPAQIAANQFTYESDPNGTRCPFGAHIRRANPRNADLPAGSRGFVSRLIRVFGFGRKTVRDDTVASVRFHRILRRGREYGAFLSPEDAVRAGPPGAPRGLQFICLAANISRQFEFTQNAWIMATKFNGLSEESDPILGSRQPIAGCSRTDNFSLPQEDGLPCRIVGLPQFVTVCGGAYFFLPGLSALRYLAGLSAASKP